MNVITASPCGRLDKNAEFLDENAEFLVNAGGGQPRVGSDAGAVCGGVLMRVVVLTHAADDRNLTNYFLAPMTALWREQGIDVSVVNDPTPQVDADIAFLHVDLTVVPDRYLAFAARYPTAINGTVKDISKRTISRQLLHRRADYDGPVIVKCNRNAGGGREYRLIRQRSRLLRLPGRIRRRLPWSWLSTLPPAGYRVYRSLRDVPRGVWLNPYLVVEKFLPEMRDGHYCLRTWCFLGDAETNSLSYATHPVVKRANVVRREAVDEVPESLRSIRRQLGFGFGKFDYALVDGEVVLYDTNRTPSLGGSSDALMPVIRTLAEGIHAFLPGSGARQAAPRDHWGRAAAHWNQVGRPLRPAPEDVAILTGEIDGWTKSNGPPRAFILGVTPEIYGLPWPRDASVRAIDHTPAMIHAIWPGPREDVICADWTALPLANGAADLVFCDGGLHLMRYPDLQQAFVRCMRRVVKPGGLLLLRLFVPPAEPESPEQVLDDLLSGRVADLNVLKLRLWAALQNSPEQGVLMHAVWETLHAQVRNRQSLAQRLGWTPQHLHAIDAYRDSSSRYHLVTVDQARSLFSSGFRVQAIHTPSYAMGERCPTLILKREASHPRC